MLLPFFVLRLQILHIHGLLSFTKNYQDVYNQAYDAALRLHYLLESENELSEQAKTSARKVVVAIKVISSLVKSTGDSRALLAEATRRPEEMIVWLAFCRDLDAIDTKAARSLKEELSADNRTAYGNVERQQRLNFHHNRHNHWAAVRAFIDQFCK